MFRTSVFTSMFLAAALGIVAMGAAAAPASASPSRVFGSHVEQPLPHVHLITSPHKSMIHNPSKKKPL